MGRSRKAQSARRTGLYYYGARYYDPEIGRFITPDTIVQAPYDPQTFNRYTYCRNNPIKYIDPSGYGIFDSIKKFFKKVGKFFKKWGGTIASVAFTMMGMPYIGAFVGSAINTFANGGSIADFGIGLGVGLVAGWAGGHIAGGIARHFGMNLAGIETALLRGGLSGTLGGMGSAAIYNGDIGEGAWKGAAGGMAVGSLVWAKNAYVTSKFLKKNVNWDSSITPNDKARITQAIKEIGQSPIGQRTLSKFTATNQTLTIASTSGLGGFVHPAAPNTVNINTNTQGLQGLNLPAYNQANTLDLATLVIHEMGHTQAVSGMRPDPLNVSYSENPYRAWTGLPSRTGYYQEGDVAANKPWYYQY